MVAVIDCDREERGETSEARGETVESEIGRANVARKARATYRGLPRR